MQPTVDYKIFKISKSKYQNQHFENLGSKKLKLTRFGDEIFFLILLKHLIYN